MPSLNVNLINGTRQRRPRGDAGEGASVEEMQKKQSAEFQEHLGFEEKTLQTNTKEIDPAQLKKVNDDFLYSMAALNTMDDAYKRASKQTSAAHEGDKKLIGSKEHLAHANRKITLKSQEHMLGGPAVQLPGVTV